MGAAPKPTQGIALMLALIASVLLSVDRGAAQSLQDEAPRSVAFVGVNVIPMTGEEPLLADQTVIVKDGRIAAIGPRRGIAVPEDAVRIETAGRYLMPALADMHAHLEHFDNPAYLQLFLVHGVTSVRSMDGRPNILEWRSQAAAGTIPAPLIFTAGQVLDGDPPVRDDNRVLRNAEEARLAVAEHADAGYDFLKVYNNLSAESFRAVVAAARARQLPVAGHVPNAVPVEEALASGMVSIEHVGDYSALIEAGEGPLEQTTAAMRRRLAFRADPVKMTALAVRLASSDTWAVPTLVTYERGIARPEVLERWLAEPEAASVDRGILRYYWQAGVERAGEGLDEQGWALVEQARANRLALLGAFRRAGVKLLVGTDTPQPFVFPGASVHEELALFVEAGFSPAQALAIATRDAARFMGQERAWGTVRPGMRADLLLLEANPLVDIRATRRIAGVMAQGRWLSASRLEAMQAVVESIAQASE